MGTFVKVDNLTHFFGEKIVLDNISFQVKQGEIIGLLGPSGAGKTTLVNLLTGQITPTKGTIIFESLDTGQNLWKESLKSEKKDAEFKDFSVEKSSTSQISKPEKKAVSHKKKTVEAGIMMDHFGLYDRLSVWSNLKIFAKLYSVSDQRIDELLKKTELSQAKKTIVGKLSKGMKSRVNFCRALLKKADILFLDEPTCGLDPATTKKLHELILEEKKSGTTIFLTTHNMYEARQLCDNILLLNDGKIIEQGVPEELCLKYYFEKQIEVILKNGERHKIPNTMESAKVLAEWMEQENILSIHSKEPNLETVFLYLTGQELDR